MGHDVSNVKNLFDKSSFFYENVDAFSVRFDYFSKPDFLKNFFEKFNPLLNRFFQKELPLSYRMEAPNEFMLEMINIDSLTEILNTTFGQITNEKLYIYNGKEFAFLENEPIAKNPIATLMIGSNYCCLYIGESIISEKVKDFIVSLYEVMYDLNCAGEMSLVNLEVMASGRLLTNETGYLQGDCYGKYHPIPAGECDIQHHRYRVDKDGYRINLSNIFRITDVCIGKGEVLRDMREQRLTLILDQELHGDTPNEFVNIFDNLLVSGNNFMASCVK